MLCSRKPLHTSGQEKASTDSVMIVSVAPTLTFESDILPILKIKCSPCHFTGGKMYEKLPFDKGQTIVDHEEGVLRRIQDGEGEKIRAYIQSQKDS